MSARIGCRVDVWDVAQERYLGKGHYEGEVLIGDLLPAEDKETVEEAVNRLDQAPEDERASMGETFTLLVATAIKQGMTTPKIVLDSGETIYGFDCWWREEE